MLQRQYRLPARQRLSHTQNFSTPFFLCKIAKNNVSYARFGFIISKTIDKRAVVRNRSKRVLRAIVEKRIPHIVGGYDVLFIIRKPLLLTTPELEDALEMIIKKARLDEAAKMMSIS